MAPDMLLGLDAARGADRTAPQIINKKTGKVVIMDNVEFHCSPIWTEQELRSTTETLKNFNVSCTAEVKLTHKEARHMKRNLRAMLGKKPRLPRKKKKAFKKWAVKQAQSHVRAWISLKWPNAQPLIDFYEKKLFEAASVKLQEDIYRHMGASGNTIKEIIKPLH